MKDLENRLQAVLAIKRSEVLSRLLSGVAATLDEMQQSLRFFFKLLSEGKLETTIPSIDVNSDLLSWRDYLGFASLLLAKIGADSSSDTIVEINAFDTELRVTLPRIIELYRNAGDHPTPYPDRFPKSFWWRHIL